MNDLEYQQFLQENQRARKNFKRFREGLILKLNNASRGINRWVKLVEEESKKNPSGLPF